MVIKGNKPALVVGLFVAALHAILGYTCCIGRRANLSGLDSSITFHKRLIYCNGFQLS